MMRRYLGLMATVAALALSGLMAGCASTGTPMREITSAQLATHMTPGWNLGNSLEAIGGETAWGNPPATQDLMDAVKAAGFKPTPEYVAVQNGFNQVFVDTVRATGGNNARRHLVVQTFNTNIDWGHDHFVMLRDTVHGRLMIEVHYYDPYNFAINRDSRIWQWGAIATDPAATEPHANEATADAQFQKMKSRFVDPGFPVLMGEYAAMYRKDFDPAGTYRNHWAQVVTASAVRHGIVPMWWDNGYPGHHEMGLFNRSTGAQYFPDLVRAIVDGANHANSVIAQK